VRVLTFYRRLAEEVESQTRSAIEDAINRLRYQPAMSIGSGQLFIIITFNLERDIETATQDVRDRWTTCVTCPPERPALISKSAMTGTDHALALSSDRSRVNSPSWRTSGEGTTERSAASASGHCRWAQTRINVGSMRPAWRLPDPHHRGAQAVVRRTPMCRAGTSPQERGKQTLRTMGRVVAHGSLTSGDAR